MALETLPFDIADELHDDFLENADESHGGFQRGDDA